MLKMYFTQDIPGLNLALSGKTLCVYHKNYSLPDIDAHFVTLPVLIERCKSDDLSLSAFDNMIFVGTNYIINPANRTLPIFEVLFNGVRAHKISIDHTPFVSQPWRTWFHFGIVNAPYSSFDYSYRAETAYNQFKDDFLDYDPFSLDEMIKYSTGVVCSERKKFFDNYNVVEMQVLPSVVDEYKDLRDELLSTEKGIHPVLVKLSRFAQNCCKQRNVPRPHVIFNRPDNLTIIKTNLGIDNYLVQVLMNMIELTNNYLESMWRICHE